MIELAAQARDEMYEHLMTIFNDPSFMELSIEARDALYAAQRLNDGIEPQGLAVDDQARVIPDEGQTTATDVPIASDAVYRALASVRTEHGDALSDRSCYQVADAIDEIIDLRIRNYSSKEV